MILLCTSYHQVAPVLVMHRRASVLQVHPVLRPLNFEAHMHHRLPPLTEAEVGEPRSRLGVLPEHPLQYVLHQGVHVEDVV